MYADIGGHRSRDLGVPGQRVDRGNLLLRGDGRLDLLADLSIGVVLGPAGLSLRERQDRREPPLLVLDTRQRPVDRVGRELGTASFLRPPRRHPPGRLHRGEPQADVLGQARQRFLDRVLAVPGFAAPLPHRFDLQGPVPDRELAAGLLFDDVPQLGHDLLVARLADGADGLVILGHGFHHPSALPGAALRAVTGQGPHLFPRVRP
ncbi:hypothetical protein SLNWT_1255 [Streptomyces albus]|uniref:Uncharacterized protein n=1 Tax=Streptomyces albus (strain ATCC 21838 / DSM 41398 / FERM P-419 / JCM 4703 / NBRC 107858) TaxID=1081613 RepID=A0A0B5ESB6_STRA4|nr:hypothetical protein SLNWT_1255 [Streptomyces albus]AOU75946.1 hypothetical protein SLNHY_1255 [Streptomyces albus]